MKIQILEIKGLYLKTILDQTEKILQYALLSNWHITVRLNLLMPSKNAFNVSCIQACHSLSIWFCYLLLHFER